MTRLATTGTWTSALGRAETSAPDQRASAVLVLLGPQTQSGLPRLGGPRTLSGPQTQGDPQTQGGASTSPAYAVHLLLTRRSDALRHHPGQVAFPGGGIDPGETPERAAIREAVEECAVDAPSLDLLGTLPPIPLTFSGNVVTPVLAWEPVPTPLVPDGVETVSAFRVPFAHLIDPANRGVVRLPVATPNATRLETPAFAVADHIVWGFTAFVVDALLDALGWARPWDHDREIPLPAP